MRHSLLTLLFLLLPGTVLPQGIAEYDMKATYIYNFAAFTEWPTTGSSTFAICILGQDPFGESIKKIEGKSIHGQTVRVTRVASTAQTKDCRVLFVPERESANMGRIANELGQSPILTIAESPVAAEAMLIMTIDGQRLGFDVQSRRIKESKLEMSSKLMKLARSVR